MSETHAPSLDPRYVAARRVLLDALDALRPHDAAVVVAGAQAVYLRAGTADLAVAPFTTDGDLALDPAALATVPALEAAMRAAGFMPSLVGGHVEPGVWVSSTMVDGVEIVVPVDLIVPEGVAPPGGRRGARLPGHDPRAARRARGLEAALIDHSPMTIASLEPGDDRQARVEVSGIAALLIAKAHKLGDRVASGRTDRLVDKDAADVVRLMQTSRPAEVATTMATLSQQPMTADVTIEASERLRALFGRRGRPGIEMASRALRIAMSAEVVEALCVSWIAAWQSDRG